MSRTRTDELIDDVTALADEVETLARELADLAVAEPDSDEL